MTDDRTFLVSPATGPRGLTWLRHRLGLHADHVLVVPSSANPAPTFAELRRAPEAWWVAAREFADIRDFELRAGPDGERAFRVQVQLHWWVHDARTVALRRPVDAVSFICRDVENRIRKATAMVHDADEGRLQDELDAALAHPMALAEYGLSYRPVGAFLRAEGIPDSVRAALDEARWAVPLEREQQRLTRVRLEFHRALIREGPQALVAYWLTRFPDQIKAVVDHLDHHGPAAGADLTLSTELLALLGSADDFERNQLRKSIVAGLAASGPRGAQVLRTLGLWDDLLEGGPDLGERGSPG
ncbi:hypothetical protein [Embleya scabrispora]|uniref:hypothetical protein n=1 Tax=Embleya scabrispora TaxID=159449 RepID=UPI0003647419|nr:hypothetical protein [Embleya scabrispora]MYS82436.1 hypothetical protein [Streptomyces sp. SID5474]